MIRVPVVIILAGVALSAASAAPLTLPPVPRAQVQQMGVSDPPETPPLRVTFEKASGKYCAMAPRSTGSRIRARICRTRAEWIEEGYTFKSV